MDHRAGLLAYILMLLWGVSSAMLGGLFLQAGEVVPALMYMLLGGGIAVLSGYDLFAREYTIIEREEVKPVYIWVLIGFALLMLVGTLFKIHMVL